MGDNWISVDERTPDHWERVLVFGSTKGVVPAVAPRIAYMAPWDSRSLVKKKADEAAGIEPSLPVYWWAGGIIALNVTHWRPLPEPPPGYINGKQPVLPRKP